MISNVKCKLVNIDKDWDNRLSQYPHDIYHLNSWLSASTLIDKGDVLGLIIQVNNKFVLIPIFRKYIDELYWDAHSAYGYSSPLIDPELSMEEIEEAFSEAIHFLKEQYCVSWFMRLHPLLNSNIKSRTGYIIQHGPTLSIDLRKTKEEHWTETQNRHRRGINKAIKKGIFCTVEQITIDNISIFEDIYNETMQFLDATDFYFFPKSYYQFLAANLADNLLVITAYDGDNAIASSIYTLCPSSLIMQFHLGGTLNAYRDLQPSKFITHTARNWGRENGYNILHLGGGVGAKEDSLYEYKKGFSSQEHIFSTWRIIVDKQKYIELSEQMGYSQDDINNISDFFPLYRKGVKS